MFNKLDTALLGKFQRFSDTLQQCIGVMKFSLQKWSLIMYTIFGVCMIMIRINGSLASILIAVFILVSINQILDIEKQESIFLKKGSLMQSIYHSPNIRVPILSLGIISLPLGLLIVIEGSGRELIDLLVIIFFLFFVYFSVCVPRPPSKSKLRKLYEKGLWKLNDSLQPAPIPTER